MLKKILIVILLFLSFFTFYKISEQNYEKHNEIKKTLVEHPENLPKSNFAKITAFGFQNLKADYYRLKTVQYIGGNAFHSEYKVYLFKILDLVTDLNPFFESPYIIGQLLLPAYEPRYEMITKEENEIHVEEAINLGLKGIKNFCNAEKINLISEENDLEKIWASTEYKDPCQTYKIPFYLAYVYFFYYNQPLEASKYYKVASACSDSPDGAKLMSAIMQGKGGDREKSFFMFLTLASSVQGNDEVCNLVNNEFHNIGYGIFTSKTVPLTGELLKNIYDFSKKAFGDTNENDNIYKDVECSNYLNKAVRELNLHYIEEANKKYILDNGEPSYVATQLYDEGYINYLPIDFQQYEDHGIIYIYNSNTGNYDYMLGNY